MRSEFAAPGAGAEGPEPMPGPVPESKLEPEAGLTPPPGPLDAAANPGGLAREGDSVDFELDPGLEVDPVDAGAMTWGHPGAVDGAAVTISGMPGLDDTARPLPEIPGYDLLHVLARGGMGVVYLARSRELNRLCALKMILAGEHAGPDAIRRFFTEAGTVARLKHPGIVQVYRLGQHDGRPFLELEFLDGGSLFARLDGTPWEAQRAAALMISVADAVAEAHRQGIVHRDIKPGNILLDADDRPKISDFGLARQAHLVSGLTDSGEILGSPWYMAPEQADGRIREIGPPADVHALGAVLYELLTGRPPFKAATILSTLALVKSSAPVSPRRLVPAVPKDLDTIVLHCLEKGADARYADASELAADLSRFLRGESVHARPIGPWIRLGRWCARNPLLAGLEAAVFGLLLATAVIASLLYLRGVRNAHEQRALNARLQEQVETAQIVLEDSRTTGEALRVTQEALNRALYASRTNLAEASYEAGDLPRLRHLLDLLAPRPDATDPRGWEYDYLWRIGQGARPVLLDSAGEATVAAFSPDGGMLAAAQRDGQIVLRDVRAGAVSRRLNLSSADRPLSVANPGEVLSLAFSPDGRTLATGGADRWVVLWDIISGLPVNVFPGHPGAILSLAFSPDGRTLARGGDDGRVILWDADHGGVRLNREGPPGGALSVAFSPDGTELALGSDDGRVIVLDARTGEEIHDLHGHDGPVRALAYSPDDARFVSAGADGLIQVWDAGTGEMLATLTGHAGEVNAVVFHPDGRRLASAGTGRAVKLWDLVSGQELLTLNGPRAAILRVAFSANGTLLTCACLDGTLGLWDATPAPGSSP